MSDINKWNTIVRWNNVIAIEQETLKHRSTEWVRASDHDRLMKEKDAEVERLKVELGRPYDKVDRLFEANKKHLETIARQSRVIEKLKDAVTCVGCAVNESCPYAWDGYNTNGDCLAEK